MKIEEVIELLKFYGYRMDPETNEWDTEQFWDFGDKPNHKYYFKINLEAETYEVIRNGATKGLRRIHNTSPEALRSDLETLLK